MADQNDIFKQLKKIIHRSFKKEYIQTNKKDLLLAFPIGLLFFAGDKWVFSLDYNSFIENINTENIVITMTNTLYLIRDLVHIVPNLEFTQGYYSVINENNKYIGVVLNEDILEYMEKNKTFYDITKNILSNKTIVEFEEQFEKSHQV